MALKVCLAVGGFKALGGFFQIGRAVGFDADGGMRTHQRADAALDTGFAVPFGAFERDVAFFILRGAGRESAVHRKFGHGQVLAAARKDFAGHFFYEFGRVCGHRRADMQRGIGAADFYFHNFVHSGVHGVVVHLNDFFAFLGISFFDGALNGGNGFVFRQHAGDGEERRLHDDINAGTHTGFLGDFGSVNSVEFELAVYYTLLRFKRQILPQVLRVKGRIDQHDRVGGGFAQHVVLFKERELVNADEISAGNKVRRTDFVFAEADVGNGLGTGFFGVVFEVAL